jgi:hypothetical protein
MNKPSENTFNDIFTIEGDNGFTIKTKSLNELTTMHIQSISNGSPTETINLNA